MKFDGAYQTLKLAPARKHPIGNASISSAVHEIVRNKTHQKTSNSPHNRNQPTNLRIIALAVAPGGGR